MTENSKIYFFCSVKDFRNYTRRTTIEAIGKLHPGTIAICMFSYWKRKNAILESDKIKVLPYYYFFPLFLLKNVFFNKINHLINQLVVNHQFNQANYICLTTPPQCFLIPHFKDKVRIFILSDPYFLMEGYKKEDEAKIIENSKYIFATSKALIHTYLPKYFGNNLQPDTVVHYWPNCVDIEAWDINKINKNNNISKLKPKVIGFAGNFMKVTDIDLLGKLVKTFTDYTFVLAGKVIFQPESREYKILHEIFKSSNVEYKGFIPYKDIQKEIMGWDVGIMIDLKTEVASYHHHNKLYQYLALGKPVVYQINHNDYSGVNDVAFGAKNFEEFKCHLEMVFLKLDNNHSFFDNAIAAANKNTSAHRGQDFLHIIKI